VDIFVLVFSLVVKPFTFVFVLVICFNIVNGDLFYGIPILSDVMCVF